MRTTAAPRDGLLPLADGRGRTAFGGAIRDMWKPTCLGDPGKVSDAEYYCATDDGGGVHTQLRCARTTPTRCSSTAAPTTARRSPASASTKAAPIYCRAMTATRRRPPTSPTTRTRSRRPAPTWWGQPINEVELGRTTTRPRRPDDHGRRLRPGRRRGRRGRAPQGARAVQLPADARPEPPACAAGHDDADASGRRTSRTVWPAGRRPGVSSPAAGVPWVRRPRRLPRATRAAWPTGRRPDQGNCNGAAEDFVQHAPRSQPGDHDPGAAQGAEAGLRPLHGDGERLRRRQREVRRQRRGVQGHPGGGLQSSTVRPEADTAAAGNTNPLAGQPGFTGTDGGEVAGSWGTVAGRPPRRASGRRQVQFRFDIGRDGCGGNDGWYVDNVEVATCKPAQERRPSRARGVGHSRD